MLNRIGHVESTAQISILKGDILENFTIEGISYKYFQVI